MGTVVPVGVLNQDTGTAIRSCKSPLVMLLGLTELNYRVCFKEKNKDKCDMNLCTSSTFAFGLR